MVVSRRVALIGVALIDVEVVEAAGVGHIGRITLGMTLCEAALQIVVVRTTLLGVHVGRVAAALAGTIAGIVHVGRIALSTLR